MNPIELLLKYPKFAQQIGPLLTPKQNPNNQRALDMAMQMATPLMMGQVRPGIGRVRPGMGPGEINAVTRLIHQTLTKRSTTTPLDYEDLMAAASREWGMSEKAVRKMDVVEVAKNLLDTMQRKLNIPRFRP